MKLSQVKKVFNNEKGERIEYTAMVCRGAISGLDFEVSVKPFDLTSKKMIQTYFEKGNVVVRETIKNNEKLYRTYFEIDGISFPVIVSDEGKFIIRLYDSLSQKSGK